MDFFTRIFCWFIAVWISILLSIYFVMDIKMSRLNVMEEQLISCLGQNVSKKSSALTLENRYMEHSYEAIDSKLYHFEDILKLNWFDAANSCRRMGGFLASFEDESEMQVINQRATRQNLSFFWLDITDLAEKGEFMTSATGKRPSFLKWADHQPGGNVSYGCVGLVSGAMVLNDCYKKAYFICQAEGNQVCNKA